LHLAEGVDVPESILDIVLDAIASTTSSVGHIHVDIADLKIVISQLGSRLSSMELLSDDRRRLAEPALYSEIVKRCTSI
jgi:hypothetical protein